MHCFPPSGLMAWVCPSYLAACVFHPSLCLSPLPAEAALHGAPALWHSARHRHCTTGRRLRSSALHGTRRRLRGSALYSWALHGTCTGRRLHTAAFCHRPNPPCCSSCSRTCSTVEKNLPQLCPQKYSHESPKAEAREFALSGKVVSQKKIKRG